MVQSNLSLTNASGKTQRYEPDVHITQPIGSPGLSQASTGKFTQPSFAVELADMKPTPYLEIRRESEEIITTIEVLSPGNKDRKTGFDAFREKQDMLARNGIHLVEIDLLQKGRRRWLNARAKEAAYLTDVYWAGSQIVQMWESNLGEPLPTIPIPLQFPDGEVPLDLEAIIQTYYQRSGILKRLGPVA